MVLIERPLVAILDAEWRSEDWAGSDGSDTTALGLELARSYAPSLGALLAPLHPPPGVVPQLLQDAEGAEDSASEGEEALRNAVSKGWASVAGLPEAEKERLRHVVRLNSLGFYTNSEQLCHHGNFTALTGSGIYALASGFNHSCAPNITRFSVGDVTAFITNRPVEAGDELCISYIESELLCAPQSVRGQSLNRDFTCACPSCSSGRGESFPANGQRRYLLVDEQLQASLALLPPGDRVEAVQAFLRGDLSGAGGGSDEDAEEEEGGEASSSGPLVILGKDAQELRVVEAVAFMQTERYAEALLVWRRLASFVCRHCPPFDEALTVYAVQAALCALAMDDDCAAARYASAAAAAHLVACGADLFRWRYRTELDNSSVSDEVKRRFWELPPVRGSPPVVAWSDAVAEWAFTAEESVEAYDII